MHMLEVPCWFLCGMAVTACVIFATIYVLLDRMTPKQRLRISRLCIAAALQSGDADADDDGNGGEPNKQERDRPCATMQQKIQARLVEKQWGLIKSRMGDIEDTPSIWSTGHRTYGRVTLHDPCIHSSMPKHLLKRMPRTPMSLAPENRARLETLGFRISDDCMEAVFQFGDIASTIVVEIDERC